MKTSVNREPIPPSSVSTPGRRSRRGLFRLFLLFGLLLVLALAFWNCSSPEPKYQGVTLSAWLDRYENEVDADPQREEAAMPIRQIGSNAVPILVQWLSASDSALKTTVVDWVDSHFRGKFNFLRAEDYHQRALNAFGILGPTAKSAIPDLEKMMRQPDIRKDAVLALRFIGPDAMPILVKNLTGPDNDTRDVTADTILDSYSFYNESATTSYVRPDAVYLHLSTPTLVNLLQDTNVAVRVVALLQLRQPDQLKSAPPSTVVPVLVKGLATTNVDEYREILLALGRFGANAKPAAPAMFAALNQPRLRVAALHSLKTMGMEPSAIIPTLEQNLQSTNVDTVKWAASAIGGFQSEGRPGIPALLKAAANRDADTLTVIYWSIIKIDPEVAKANAKTLDVNYRDPQIVVPALIKQLTNEDPLVRRVAAYRLGNFGSDARSAFPALLSATIDKDDSVCAAAVEALKKIDPQAASEHGIR